MWRNPANTFFWGCWCSFCRYLFTRFKRFTFSSVFRCFNHLFSSEPSSCCRSLSSELLSSISVQGAQIVVSQVYT